MFWPVIDDALKAAAINQKVQVKLLISYWNHSAPAEDNFLKSLSSLSNVYQKVSIEVVCKNLLLTILSNMNIGRFRNVL